MRSIDDGATWRRVGIGRGCTLNAMVRTLMNHPQRPEIVYAATDKGLIAATMLGRSGGCLIHP